MEENISTFVSPTLISMFGYCGDILLGSLSKVVFP